MNMVGMIDTSKFVLTRDGVELMRGEYIELVAFLHNQHSYSVDHALKYEGYAITERKELNHE